MDSNGNDAGHGKRPESRVSRKTSGKSRRSVEGTPGSPKFLTSFPSLSPQSTSPPPALSNIFSAPSAQSTPSKGRRSSAQIVRSPIEAPHATRRTSATNSQPAPRRKASDHSNFPTATASRKTSASISRTLRGAASLHKTILSTLTFQPVKPDETPSAVFDDPDWDAPDPLEHASDEQIERVIEKNGGAISLLRQYSKDVAEANSRVAIERNKKLDVLEQNRILYDENELLRLQLDETQRKYRNVQNLLKRFVRPDNAGSVQVVDSPDGHFILDRSTGEKISPDKPQQWAPKPASLRTMDSGDQPLQKTISNENPTAVDYQISQPLQVRRNASAALRAVAAKASVAKDSRPHRSSIALKGDATRPDALELRAPVQAESLPPALRDDKNIAGDVPIDRLGFFFTASRETRQQEALQVTAAEYAESSSVHSFPTSDDGVENDIKTPNSQEDGSSYMAANSSSNSAELLCYAPAGPAVRFVSDPQGGVRMFVDMSTPTTPTTEVTPIVNAEEVQQSMATIVQTPATGTMTSSKAVSEGVNALNALLEKLNEAHDKQQRNRMAEWMAFHQSLRSNMPSALARASSDYGMADISRLCSKGTVSSETWKKFNALLMSGIPVALRRDVWMERTGANSLHEPGKYTALLIQADLPKYIHHEIAADVDRTLGNNVYFRHGIGKSKLTDVLVAYAAFNPSIGYSQGLNIIAANLLLMVPSAEDAFWLLAAMLENILPHEYYSRDGLISSATLTADSHVLVSYVTDYLGAALTKHLRIHAVTLDMFTPGWFISAFAACLSGEPLYRIWDVLFGMCDGRYVFCFALALLKINRKGLLRCESSEDLMLYLGGKLGNAAVGVDILVREGVRIGQLVTREDLDKRREQARQKT